MTELPGPAPARSPTAHAPVRAVAVIPVRGGALPLGADETAAECAGNVLLIGDGAGEAAGELQVDTASVRAVRAPGYAPDGWARTLAPLLSGTDLVVLPASPDGRDLAPRLSHALGRPLWAGAVAITRRANAVQISVARYGGRVLVETAVTGPAVATLTPGVAGIVARRRPAAPVETLDLVIAAGHDPEVLEVVPPTAATIDLAEAPRVFAGGAGLAGDAAFELLTEVAGRAGASMGATRIVVDAGRAPFARQIGTTGVTIDPHLYVAFGISGAVQHITGIGAPEHVISVNTDPSCPMMAMADLAVVADARHVLRELARLLDVPLPDGWEEAARA